MRISGFQSESYQDWEEGLSSVIYTGKCNLKCPACHADNLMKSNNYADEKDILKRLDRKSKYIDRLTISGGEPTLEKDLILFLEKASERGYKIKLDTNGTNPEILKGIKDSSYVNHVAMDIKASKEFYTNVSGNKSIDINDIEKSASIVSEFPSYEFRTTVVPIIKDSPAQDSRLRKEHIEWMNTEDADKMASWIFNLTGKNQDTQYFIQRFRPVKGGLIDSRLEEWEQAKQDNKNGVK